LDAVILFGMTDDSKHILHFMNSFSQVLLYMVFVQLFLLNIKICTSCLFEKKRLLPSFCNSHAFISEVRNKLFAFRAGSVRCLQLMRFFVASRI
jgi:hypothetical protein